jgi:hypothetical protein
MLLRQDFQEQLNKFGEVRLLQLRLRRDSLTLLNEANASLPAALRATSESLGSEVVELTFRQPPHSRHGLGQRAFDLIGSLVGNPRLRDSVDQFKVKAVNRESGRVETFDLLKDQLVSSRQVVLQQDRHRGVESESMFDAISSAYQELRDELREAAGVSDQT